MNHAMQKAYNYDATDGYVSFYNKAFGLDIF